MAINSDGNIYGIFWEIYDAADQLITRYEQTYPEKMTLDQIQLIKVEYDKLIESDFNNIQFGFYTKCTSTFCNNLGIFMSWFPKTKESLEEFFLNGTIPI